MIKDDIQKQEGGDHSSNFQGKTVNVYSGLSYKDVKEIALDIFTSNFIKLKSEAAIIAKERAEEITEKILQELQAKTPEALEEFIQPSMQDALFSAQKEYAKSGDKDLGDLLVDIIVDRANVPKRNILQIVLDESLHIAPKLTSEHLDALTLNFLLIRTRRLDIGTLDDLKKHFLNRIIPFTKSIVPEYANYNYLEYLRCGHIRTGNYGALEKNLKEVYKGFFSRGFTKEELENEFGSSFPLDKLIVPCLHDKTKFQIGVFDEEVIEIEGKKINLGNDFILKIKSFFNNTTLDDASVKNKLLDMHPNMSRIFDFWEKSLIKKFELSSVGIAIAHATPFML